MQGRNYFVRKFGSPQKARKKKPGWEIRLKTQINKSNQKRAKIIEQKNDTGTCRNKKEKATHERIAIQLEINQKVLVKEGRLKRYRQGVKQYRQNRTFQNNKAEIHVDLLKTTLKNIKLENARLWWNAWFLIQEIHLHSRQTSTRNEQMPLRRTCTRMDNQRKDQFDPKGPKHRDHTKQLRPITCLLKSRKY